MAIQNTFYLDVDIKRDNYVEEPQVTQNDNIAFVLRLTDDGIDKPIEGVSTYTLASLRADGQSVLTVGTLTGPNEVTFELGSTEVSVPGRVKAAIQLYDADGRVSSIPFTYEVTKDLATNYVPSKDEQTLIELVLGEGPVILAKARQATADAIQATSDLTVLKTEVVEATNSANTAANHATTEGDRASAQADRADTAATNAEGVYNAILPALPNIEGWGYDPVPYSASTTYERNNIVSHDGSTFISLIDGNVGNTPSLTPNGNWGVVARKGVDGTGAVSTVNGVGPDASGDVTLPEPDLSGLATKGELQDIFTLSPSIIKFPVHESWRAAQGVTTDGKFIYTFTDRTSDFSLENIITVYSMDGKFISEKRLAYTGKDAQGKFMSFGDGNIIDGFIYVTVYNINGGGNPLVSRVVKFNIDDLSINQVYEIGGQTAESVTKHDGYFWTVYHDVNVVRKFDLDFNFIKEFPLQVDSTPHGGFQGSLWEGNYFYANLHGHNWNSDPNPFAELRKYRFDGASFIFVEKIKPPTLGCSQGISEYNGYYFWNDRPNHSVIITKSIKKGNLVPKTMEYKSSDSFKPTLLNGWEDYDLLYDRTARITKTDSGLVLMNGLIKVTNTVVFDDPYKPILKIPKAFAPKYSLNFICLTNVGMMRVGIVGKNSASGDSFIGEMVAYNITSSTGITWLSLDNIIYPILD